MKTTSQLCIVLAATFVLLSCSTKEPPKDSTGTTPEQVLLDTYVLIVEGKYDEAQKN